MSTTENSQTTRQQLYDRIKASSKDAVILEEMQRLGFWKEEQDRPSLPQKLIEQEAALTQELNELLRQKKKYDNREAALKEMRKARLEASRKKREENKARRKKEKAEKAARYKARKDQDITYLGTGVSAGLNNKQAQHEKLLEKGLPVLENAEQLAQGINISVGELRFLAYDRPVSKISHYVRFYLPKRSGGKRLISTPMPRLKNAQYWILEHLLDKVKIKDTAHGFVKQRSILSNALPHLKADVVINLDLKDFFPSVSYRRVKGLFLSFGYSEQVATILALLCTEAENDLVEIDGECYYVAGTERALPQGAPTSPAITNILCRKLDARLQGIAQKLGFRYTRYADDLTFSATGDAVKQLKTLMGFVKRIIKDEDFTLHPDKIRVLRKGSRQEVTGIVVNDKPSVKAKDLDRFRALLFQIEKDGLEGKHWNNSTNLLASIKGYADFVHMVDPVKGKVLKERVQAILAKYEYKHEIRHRSKAQKAKEQATLDAELKKKKKPWWKFW